MSTDPFFQKAYDVLHADDADALQALIANGLAADAADEDGDTLLALAVMFGASKCSRILLASGANVNLPVGKYQCSILSIAAGRGQAEWVRLLISNGAKVNATDCDGETPLIWAAKGHFSAEDRCSQVACVSLLLQAGANLMQADKFRNTPLSQAESNGNRPVCCLLRQAAAAEKTPLMQAVWEGDADKLSRMLAQDPGKTKRRLGKKNGVNQADAYGYTPLHVAALPGREACLPILLAAGAKPDAKDRENVTPLALATASANKEAVQALLAAGAKPDLADNEGFAPLLQAVVMKQTEMCKLLLAAGADSNKADLSKNTPLHESVGNPAIMRLLLTAGAEVDRQDEDGMTPLAKCADCSESEENIACTHLLLEAGADADCCDDWGFSPLHWACSRQNLEILRLLLAAGANPNLCDESGQTPLHTAAEARQTEAVRLLLEAGADPAVKDEQGDTARDCAKGKAAQECRALLEQAMQARGIPLATGPVMKVSEVRRKLGRKAVIFHSSIAETALEGQASYLGRVAWQLPGEEWPADVQGKRLMPLATIFVQGLPNVPAALKNVALITIFSPEEIWGEDDDDDPLMGCVIRTYHTTEGLEPCDYVTEKFTPCLLSPEPVADDLPKFPDCGGSEEIWARIKEVERAQGIDYLEDIYKEDYELHKIGGYPSYTQNEPDLPSGYSYVLQICSDFTADCMIGDCGNCYFYYNPRKKAWRVHADCY